MGGTAGLNVVAGGNVGVGTTTPNNKLDIYSTTKSAIGFSGASGDTYKWTLGMDVSNGGRFSIASSTALGTTDRFVIDGNGDVGIGTTAPGQDLHISESTDAVIRLERTSLGSAADIAAAHQDEGFIIRTRTAHPIRFATNTTSGDWTDSTRMIITSAGNVGIGTTNPGARMHLEADPAAILAFQINSLGTGAGTQARFQSNGTNVGSITVSGSATSFNTSSDTRLKENVTDTSMGLETLRNIQVHDYNFTSNPSVRMQGFLAQELYEVYPLAVTVGGDDAQTNPWAVDYSKLVPLLVRSVQEIANVTGMFKDNMIAWLGNAANGIGDFFANRVHTKELCVGDESGVETCISKAELDALMASVGSSPNSNGSVPVTETVTETDSTVTIEGVATSTDPTTTESIVTESVVEATTEPAATEPTPEPEPAAELQENTVIQP